MLRGLAAALLLLPFAAAVIAAEPELRVEPLDSPVKVRLRGLSAFSDTVAWASGREGTVLRTVDGGATWSVFHVPGAETLDFRDVQAFGADVALVMGAGPGDASRVYRTADGGRTWTLVLANPDKDGFFDCMDFDGNEGRLLGDPIDGRFQVFASNDGGRSWHWTKGPKAAKDEAAFAASGTCLMRVQEGTVVVTGGARARMHFLPDRFERKGDWHSLDAGVKPALPSSGLFSIARRETEVVAVGGNYKDESGPGVVFAALAFSKGFCPHGCGHESHEQYLAREGNDLRLKPIWMENRWDDSWFIESRMFDGQPAAYRSGIACGNWCIAVGPSGIDALASTMDELEARGFTRRPAGSPIPVEALEVRGKWRPVAGPGYDSVAIAGNVAWFSGDEGRLGRMQLPAPRQ